MAAMVIIMVVFLVMGGHHGIGGSHDAKAPKDETGHAQMHDSAKQEEEKR